MNYRITDIEAFAARFYEGRELLLVPYAYQTIFLALAQNGQASNVITMQANADFLLLGLRHRAQIGAAQTISTVTAPYVRALITDTGSNEQFTNTAIDLNNYAPAMAFDFGLPYPRIISGRSTLQVAVTNYAPTAETYTSIELSLYGCLIRVLR